MNQSHLQKLWAFVGTLLVYYSVNTWIASQGGKPILDIGLIEEGPVAGPVVALPICAVLLILLARIGSAYARLSTSANWHERLPVVFLEGIDTSTRQGKQFQAASLVTFVVVPCAAVIHFIAKISGAVVTRNEEPCWDVSYPVWVVPPLDRPGCPTSLSGVFDNAFRIAQSHESGADPGPGSVTWIPMAEPMIYLGLAGCMFVAVFQLARHLHRKI